uniref:Cadherin domain-containing protein n=1 Tax=Poecilia formosa TaxID=48698 RepID=A0A087XD96_POEFO
MDSSEISVSIKAAQRDDPLKTADAVVSVTVQDVNDNAPEFDQSSYNISLLENSPANTVVFKAVVTDKDQGGFVGTLQILPESTSFSISPDGTVRVINPEVLDREVTETFVFQIEAKETEVPNQITTAQVTVSLLDENDNSPAFTSSMYEGQVFKNQTVGNLVVKVEAEDPDDGKNGEIQYSITFGNNDGYFSINASTGEISLANLIPLKENQVLEFPLYITARDGGTISRSTSAQAIIRAPGNSKPQFLQELYQGAVEEEQEPGALVVKVNFLAISSEPVTLQVTTEADKFSISNTGEVTTTVKLDHDDGPHNYSVGISISDGVTTDTAVVEVQVTDINDNSPVFASSSVSKSVPEDTEVGSNITEVAATDKDSGFNQEIRYSLRGGDGRFFIDPVSGMVSLAAALDRETTAAYELLVVAEDQGRPARSATATLAIQVTDVNDNTPRFSQPEYQVEVSETEAVGTSLLTLSAEDPDEGANGRVTYSISEQSPSSEPAVFQLDASSGILSLVQPLNYSEVKEFTLSVQASDGGSPSLVGNGSVVVKVKDVNNNPPKFSKERYDVAISENLASGASILTLEVTDVDEVGFSNGHFVYTSDTFDINNQGVVSLKKDSTLDRETKDSYMLQVVAVDQPTDGLSATAQLNITVLDYNDNSPQFPNIPYPLEIPEGEYSAENPGEIFTIQPTDADIGLNGEVTLSLSPPHPIFSFREDGMLLVVGSLDREKTETYNLVLKASDKGSPQRENITTISVSITDVNDNKPEFSSSSYETSTLVKEAEKGKLLLTLRATDKDTGNNSLITYSFSEGHSPHLALDSETGEVTLTSDLTDVTEDTTLVLTAEATDHGKPPLSATARVVVNIRIASLVDGVAFMNSSYNFKLKENENSGVNVGQVQASAGSNLYNVSYELRTHKDLFSIDSDGSIVSTKELDKEEQEWYILDVEAVDTRTPPTSAVVMVRIQVEDVNEPPAFSSEIASTVMLRQLQTTFHFTYLSQASDPDVGDNSDLVYSLSGESSSFDMEPASGLLYVVSVADLGGKTVSVEVKATDPDGLSATTTVKGSASSSDVTIISINQPANIVEKKVPELEESPSLVSVDFNMKDLPYHYTVYFSSLNRILYFYKNSNNFSVGLVLLPIDFTINRKFSFTPFTFTPTAKQMQNQSQITFQDMNTALNLIESNTLFRKSFTSNSETSVTFLIYQLQQTSQSSKKNKTAFYSATNLNVMQFYFLIYGSFLVTSICDLEKLLSYLYSVLLLSLQAAEQNLTETKTYTLILTRSAFVIVFIFPSEIERKGVKPSSLTSKICVGLIVSVWIHVVTGSPIVYDAFRPSKKAHFNSKEFQGALHNKKDICEEDFHMPFLCHVTETDNLLSAMNEFMRLIINDINDNSPVFEKKFYSQNVSEDGDLSEIRPEPIKAQDGDTGINMTITYSITSEYQANFNIDADTGVLTVVTSFDREEMDRGEISVNIKAAQTDDPLKTADAVVSVTVEDMNDNAPEFDRPSYNATVLKNSFTNTITDLDQVGFSIVIILPLTRAGEDGTFHLNIIVHNKKIQSGSSNKSKYKAVTTVQITFSRQRSATLVQIITTISVSITDDDNKPEFSSSSYETSTVEKRQPVLVLRATDKDTGNNSLITYRKTCCLPSIQQLCNTLCSYSETGEVTLTSDLTDVTEDTTLVLTAEATDHGKPPHSTTARVVVNIRNASLVDRVVFLSSSYNFKLKENQNSGAFVGQVQASAGSDLYEVSYELRTHKDLFSIHSNGSIVSTKELDKEEQEWYFLDVEAVDTRTPPTSAVAPTNQMDVFVSQVRIQVEDVNEPPAFSSDDYEASVFSIAPYKTPVIQVKASDPDVGDNSRLVYSLPGESSSFDVEPASGLLYVVSVADLGGKTVSMEVKATDSGELSATTTVKVVVQGSASSSDVTIISLNKPENIVKQNILDLEEALGKALGWTVNIIQVSS